MTMMMIYSAFVFIWDGVGYFFRGYIQFKHMERNLPVLAYLLLELPWCNHGYVVKIPALQLNHLRFKLTAQHLGLV
uniref:Uncharacterized protein n=1 Tax=Octopus bimaculoides TaxID=37653 RepID=A0A0L8FT99_OCTBM